MFLIIALHDLLSAHLRIITSVKALLSGLEPLESLISFAWLSFRGVRNFSSHIILRFLDGTAADLVSVLLVVRQFKRQLALLEMLLSSLERVCHLILIIHGA